MANRFLKLSPLLFLFCMTPIEDVYMVNGETNSTKMTYEFKGDEKDKPGFAKGIITITPKDDSVNSGYYLLYFADDNGLIPDYDEFASIPITGKEVKYEVKDGTMLPLTATKLAAFESNVRFLDDQPAYEKAIAVVTIPESKRLKLGKAQLGFGAISDVHMNYEYYGYGAFKKWENALNFFSDQDLDYIINAGDVTGDDAIDVEPPLTQQYQKYIDIILKSDFPLDRVYQSMGNHGNTPQTIDLFAKYLATSKENHPYENSPYYSILIPRKNSNYRDNLFIFMSQELQNSWDTAAYDNFSKRQIDWVESLLEEYGEKQDTNIFLIEHAPFLNFGPGDRHYGGYGGLIKFDSSFTQTMRLKGLLTKYKDVVMMSGHTHLSLYDNENYSDEFDSFCRMIHLSSGSQPATYGEGTVFTRNHDGRYPADKEYGSQAYVVKIYDDYIVYTGYNLSTNKVIPAACYLLPIKSWGGSGYVEMDDIFKLNEHFEGKGTKEDPYVISSEEQFKYFTDAFNSSNIGEEHKMMGYRKYFVQTKDLDMSNIEGYEGTIANGNEKCFFAGNYNGLGHSITVDINSTSQRSVFPYCYGTICNLTLKGSIVAPDSAQPIRTNYGAIINCIFDVDINSKLANGVCYSNYGYFYNVYTTGKLIGTTLSPISSNDSSKSYYNVYHYRMDFNGNLVSDSYGYQSNDYELIMEMFNDKESENYQNAKAYLDGYELCEIKITEGVLEFEIKEYIPPVNDEPIEEPVEEPEAEQEDENGNKLLVAGLVCVIASILLALIAFFNYSKRKKAHA